MNKLLILGATYHEIDIVERAHNKGIYVIVTDNNLDWSKSPAKYVADEAWNISWSDIDALVLECRESKVNGIIAGFSEFRVENMIKLCDKLGLPCTLSMKQLNLTRDKIQFKNLCAKYGIRGVPEYKYGDSINFPVIVKPVDRAGSIGINVAYNQYVKGGNIALLGTSDTIMCNGKSGAPILQKAWTFPSRYESQYVSEEDGKIRKMLHGIGLKNGYVTMSAFYRNDRFYFFEAGFRLSGELSYNYYDYISGINYIDTLLDYSLGLPNSDIYEDCYQLNKCTKSIILNYFGIDGIVKKIQTPSNSSNESQKVIGNIYIKEGDSIHNETNVFKKIAMYTILSNDNMLEDIIRYINSNLHIIDNKGQELIYERVDEKSLNFLQMPK